LFFPRLLMQVYHRQGSSGNIDPEYRYSSIDMAMSIGFRALPPLPSPVRMHFEPIAYIRRHAAHAAWIWHEVKSMHFYRLGSSIAFRDSPGQKAIKTRLPTSAEKPGSYKIRAVNPRLPGIIP
jgi:hypothetical protein